MDYKYIDQELVTKFAMGRARKNKLDEWLKEKQVKILRLFSKGFRCPKRGPYILVPVPMEGSISWKGEFEDYLTVQLLRENNGSKKLARLAAKAQMEEIAEYAIRKGAMRLEARKNPLYRKAENKVAA